jgi:RHS repeat-associated protein
MTDAAGNDTLYSYLDRAPSPATSGTPSLWVLQTVTYPDTTTRTYGYTDTNPINAFAMTSDTDENAHVYADWTYDSTTGRALTSENAGGANLITVAYDDTLGTRTVTNAAGKQWVYDVATFQARYQPSSIAGQASTHTAAATTSYSYDANGFVSQVTDGNSNVSKYTNNSIGQETSRTEAYGSAVARTVSTTWNSTWREPDQVTEPNLTTNFTYDVGGKLTQLKQTDTTATSVPYSTNGQTRIWAFTYTTGGLLSTVDGPLSGSGDTVTYGYTADGYVNAITDQLSHVTNITTLDGWGHPLTSVDPNSVTTNYTYDGRGRIQSVTVNPGASQSQYGFTYDAAGNLTVITRPDGSTLTYTYDNAHRVTAVTNNLGETITYTLDALGGRTATVVRSATSAITRQQSATFDELGRVMADIGAASQTTSHAYDLDDNEITTTDPRSKVYGHAFDALNRLYQETDPDSFTTTLAYNGKDDVTSVTDARSLVTSYVRDGFGDAIRTTSPDTGITDFWYDANGKVTKQVDARSVETDFTYDAAARVLTKTFPAASAENVAFTYDATAGGNKGVGRLTSLTDQSGSDALVYDAQGRATTDARVIGANSYATAYSYDASGNILTETYPSGRIVTYSRDTLGRVSGVTTKQNAGASPVTVTSSVTYEPFGPLAAMSFGNGLTATLSYDQDYQLTGIGTTDGTTPVQSLTNGYDASGNITSITDAISSPRSQTITYDDLNRVHTAAGLYGSQTYTYDGVGNRLTRVIGGTTDTYAYAPTANQVSTVTTGGNVRSFTYLASGQASQDVRDPSNTYTYTANKNGRTVTAALNSTTVGSYLYNAYEQRVQKIAGGITTQFVYDLMGHLIAEADGTGTVQREYIWIDDLPVAMVDDTGASPILYFIHTDQLATPQKITDGTKAVVWDGAMDPFGNPASVTGTLTNNLRFPGQYADAETALNQNWNRDYDPSIGRYVQSDPTDLGGGMNTYGYVANNPYSNFDIQGLDCGVANGLLACSYPNGGPAFILPAPKGFPTFPNNLGSWEFLYHSYDVHRSIGCADPKDVTQLFINNPTPGTPKQASKGGTRNNAMVFGMDNYVTSYTTTDLNTGNPLVVNVTDGGSLFPWGYVAHEVSNGVAHTYGEGDNFKQSPKVWGQGVEDFLNNEVWGSQMDDLIAKAKCGCKKK